MYLRQHSEKRNVSITNYVLLNYFFKQKRGPQKNLGIYYLEKKAIEIFCIGVCAYVRKYLFVYSVEEGVPKGHTQEATWVCRSDPFL